MTIAKKTSTTAKKEIQKALNHANAMVAALREAQTHNLTQVDAVDVSTYERGGVELSRLLTAIVEGR